jgi:hypothetical protein
MEVVKLNSMMVVVARVGWLVLSLPGAFVSDREWVRWSGRVRLLLRHPQIRERSRKVFIVVANDRRRLEVGFGYLLELAQQHGFLAINPREQLRLHIEDVHELIDKVELTLDVVHAFGVLVVAVHVGDAGGGLDEGSSQLFEQLSLVHFKKFNEFN